MGMSREGSLSPTVLLKPLRVEARTAALLAFAVKGAGIRRIFLKMYIVYFKIAEPRLESESDTGLGLIPSPDQCWSAPTRHSVPASASLQPCRLDLYRIRGSSMTPPQKTPGDLT